MKLSAGANDELVWGIAESALQAMRAKLLGVDLRAAFEAYSAYMSSGGPDAVNEKPYEMDGDIALIPVTGPLMKGYSFWCYWYGGTSYERLQKVLAAAEVDPDVKSAKAIFDTPGGTMAGMADTCKAIRKFKAVKPIEGYISDQCCSAGYGLAAQCSSITSNSASAMIGNVGTVMCVDDVSKMFAAAGIERKVYRSAPLKGAGTYGAPISKAQDAEFQALVDTSNAEFLAEIALGRGVSLEKVKSWADAHVYLGREALASGLIDKIDGDAGEVVVTDTESDGGDNDGDSDDLDAKGHSPQISTELKVDLAATPAQFLASMLNALEAAKNGPKVSEQRKGAVPSPPATPGVTARENIARTGEGMKMKEKFVRLLSALGFKKMAVAVVSQTDESVESLLQTVSEQVHAEVSERVNNHPLVLACDAAGITTPEQLGAVLEMKALGEKYVRDLRDDAKGQAIRAYGAEAGQRIGATVEKLSYHEVKALRDGWSTEADVRFNIAADGAAAQRASAPKAVAVNADEPTEAKPKSAWEQLTEDQRKHATTAGHAKSPEAREKFAREYFAAAGKELATA